MKLASWVPSLFSNKIVVQNEQPPDALLEEDVLEIMAEVARSLAEPLDMEFERLGGVRGHIHLLYPADPKIMPWQLVRMLKSITAREVLGGPAVQERVMVRRVFFVWLLWGPVVERGNSAVKSFLISRGLPTRIFIQKKPFFLE